MKKSKKLIKENYLFCIQETITSISPLRAVYKISFRLYCWQLAQEALTFNWLTVCFELHPPIMNRHKHDGTKLKLHPVTQRVNE